MNEATARDWLTKEEEEAFIGPNTSFYTEKWRLHSSHTLKGWNWAAMFFSIEWMVYRKMYTQAVLMYLATTAVLLLFMRIDLPSALIRDVFRTIVGVVGNALYRRKALRVVQKNIALPDQERLQVLQNKGGTSVAGVLVCIAIEVCMVFFL